ncbi:8635_t:CDS:2 [Scutellospora calospora]|uniref:8635_t:CDS:1 n=1 Tax=Scutellospora calospora TaxID=85575 RepID=A0ACA9KKY4_9GLOM|nr:8635_t:CDS:2 [Scutellospora calospora]
MSAFRIDSYPYMQGHCTAIIAVKTIHTNVDTIFFFILTTVLTRSISSFFSNDREVRVKDIKKYGKMGDKELDMSKFVFLRINDDKKVSEFLGHQRLYIEVRSDEAKEYVENVQNFYRNREYDIIKKFYQKQLEDLNNENYLIAKYKETDGNKEITKNKETDGNKVITKNKETNHSIVEKIIFEKLKKPVGKRFLKEKIEKLEKNKTNIPGTKIIAKELVENAKVYANILEMGLFQYIIYSHRARKEVQLNKDEITDEENIKDKIKLDIENAKVEWIVIPELMESYADDKNHKEIFEAEITHCYALQEMLNRMERDEEFKIGTKHKKCLIM